MWGSGVVVVVKIKDLFKPIKTHWRRKVITSRFTLKGIPCKTFEFGISKFSIGIMFSDVNIISSNQEIC